MELKSVAPKLLHDQQPLGCLLTGPMVWDVFGANVVGRVQGHCCGILSQICRSPHSCLRLPSLPLSVYFCFMKTERRRRDPTTVGIKTYGLAYTLWLQVFFPRPNTDCRHYSKSDRIRSVMAGSVGTARMLETMSRDVTHGSLV